MWQNVPLVLSLCKSVNNRHFESGECIKKAQNVAKGDYARTRAIEFKYLPALNLSNFLVNILGLCSTKLKQLKRLSSKVQCWKVKSLALVRA